ncbi:MAG: TfoX/Sxy family protein [Vicinamibacterales bacterium]
MAVSRAFREFVLDQLSGVPDVTSRSMFGGLGLYSSGHFFGLVWNDILFLKVDEATRPQYVAAGMKPFNPYPGRGGTFQYYEVPLGVVESADALTRWAEAAVRIASRGPVRSARSPESSRSSARGGRAEARRKKAARR